MKLLADSVNESAPNLLLEVRRSRAVTAHVADMAASRVRDRRLVLRFCVRNFQSSPVQDLAKPLTVI